jgi:hypothetical protein
MLQFVNPTTDLSMSKVDDDMYANGSSLTDLECEVGISAAGLAPALALLRWLMARAVRDIDGGSFIRR